MIPSNKSIKFSFKEEAIYRMNVGYDLDYDLARNAFREILYLEDKHLQYSYMGMLISGSVNRGLQPHVVSGFLDAAFELDEYNPVDKYSIPDKLKSGRKTVSLCGSGKKGIKTFNITSASALVAANKQIMISKPCSHSTSSITGSADFITAIGGNLELPTSQMAEVMAKVGIGFFRIENLVPKFDAIYGGKFFAPHALSFGLAGLINPIETDYLIYGLSHPNLGLALRVLQNYQVPSVLCISSTTDGIHYVDELLPIGSSLVQGYRFDGIIGDYRTFNTADLLNLPHYQECSIKQNPDKEQNLLIALRGIQNIGSKAVIDTIAINAATILYISGQVEDLIEGYNVANKSIKEGKPLETLYAFVKESGGDINKLEDYLRKSRNI